MEDGDRPTSTDRGFTLLELLIVVALLGILSTVVILSIGGTTGTAKRRACAADYRTVLLASEAYHTTNGTYPSDEAAIASFLQNAPSLAYTVGTNPDGTLRIDAKGPPDNPNGCVSPPAP